MSESNKALMRRIFNEVFNEANHELVRDLYCEDCVGADPAVGETIEGHEGLIALLEGYRSGLPDHKYEILDMIAEGDKVVVQWKVHTPASSKWSEFSVEAISICTIKEGRVHHVVQHWDNLGCLKALGAVEPNLSVASRLAELAAQY